MGGNPESVRVWTVLGLVGRAKLDIKANKQIGKVVRAAATTDTTVRVRLSQ